VREGDRVEAGQIIARISAELTEAKLAQAEAGREAASHRSDRAGTAAEVQADVLAAEVARTERAVATAEAHLAELLAGARPEAIAEAEATVAQAEAQARAAREKLAALEAGARPQEIEQARAALQRAGAAVAAAKARVDELRAGTREQDIARAQSAVDKARAAADKARTDAERMQHLYDQGVVPADQLERAQTAAVAAAEDLAAAEAMLSLAREGPRPQTIRMAEADLAQARAAEAQAREALALVEAGPRQEEINAARAQVQQADQLVEAGRQRLAALRAGPTAENIAVARRRVAEARAAQDLARRRAREAEVGTAQAAAARADEQRASAAVGEAEAAVSKHTVTAPVAGVVDSINIEPGEVAAPGASIVTLVDPTDLWVQVYVPEPDLARVKIGQRARVSVDGVRQPFEAEVYWIAEQAEFTPKYIQTRTERARLVYALRVRPVDPQGALKPGMPADVELSGKL
ncbi:MAG: HlyD family efflux transporter periplasmic adaptor subunit, partial [Armatimonadetes bacterium]|nr:HlyD family efflux transporter periplasmic adaptor subunit [Armatimonadota bacterium]